MIDVQMLKDRADLLALVRCDTQMRKVASTRGGEYAGPCPFCGGHDRLRVQPERGLWWCRQCSGERWQDAIAYVMQRDSVGLVEAAKRLGVDSAALPTPSTPSADPEPTSAWRRAALEVVERCEAALWSAAGAQAREYLHHRGLCDATLRQWRLGYNPATQRLAGLHVERGILIPWFIAGGLWQVKIRRPQGEPRYVSVAGGRPLLYGADTLAGQATAVLTEGELDALVLWQEAGDLAGVATLGSASKGLDRRALSYLLPVSRLLVAYDTDEAGERGASGLLALSARMHRIRPPAGKDITEFWQAGGHLRDWLQFAIARLDAQATRVGAEAQTNAAPALRAQVHAAASARGWPALIIENPECLPGEHSSWRIEQGQYDWLVFLARGWPAYWRGALARVLAC